MRDPAGAPDLELSPVIAPDSDINLHIKARRTSYLFFNLAEVILLSIHICNMTQLDRDGMNENELHHGVRGGVVLHTSTKHHGLSLWPPPSNDPHDPLCWPRWLKVLALCTTALCNFTANFSGAGPSVATQLFEMQFRKSASEVNNLLTVS